MTGRFRIALAQLNPVMGDIAGNLKRARDARVRVPDADVILFSELFITGYPPEDLVLKGALQADAREAIEALAADTTFEPQRRAEFLLAAGDVMSRHYGDRDVAEPFYDRARELWPGHVRFGRPSEGVS